MASLGQPLDRLAASIIDLSIVLIPLIVLVSSPFRLLFVRSLLLQNEFEFLISLLSIAGLAGILIVSYMTLMTSVLGATFGKLVFGLRVVNIWTQRHLTMSEALFRSLVWLASAILGFVPFLTILSDDKRRPWHDRFSDSIVLSSGQPSQSPTVYEKMFVQSIWGSVSAFLVVMAMVISPLLLDALKSSALMPFTSSQFHHQCDEVDWALSDWPEVETEPKEARLNVVLTLFAAGEVSKTCLEKESLSFIEQNEAENETAYLAQAFVHSENPDVSNKYLQKVCEIAPKSSSCVMSQVVEKWSDSDWEAVEASFSGFTKHTPLHVAVWAARHFIKRREFVKAEGFLSQLALQPALAPFLAHQRVRLLIGMNRVTELNLVATTALETLSSNDRLEVAMNMCEHNYFEDGCKSVTQNAYCDLVKRQAFEEPEELASAKKAVTAIRTVACSQNSEEFEQLMGLLPMQESLEFAEAFREKVQGNIAEARVLMTKLGKQGDLSKYTSEQVELEEMALWDVDDQFLLYVSEWKQKAITNEWGRKGQVLLRKAAEQGEFKLAEKVGQLLLDSKFSGPSVVRPLIYSMYASGQLNKAKLTYQTLVKNEGPLPTSGRAPASAKTDAQRYFEEVSLQFRKSRR